MNEPLVIENLSVHLGARKALDRISLTARDGAIHALIGPNGAGKSTLLRAILGLTPHAGTVRIHGADPSTMTAVERARAIAYVPQQSELRAALSAFDVIAQGRFAHRSGFGHRLSAMDREAIDEAMDLTGAGAFASRMFLELSQGERQRVLLARALATRARLILLDEPTAALDIGYTLAFFERLRELAKLGYAIVIVLHSLGEALEYTDIAWLLHKGRLVRQGPTREVIVSEHLRPVYGVDIEANASPRFSLSALSRLI